MAKHAKSLASFFVSLVLVVGLCPMLAVASPASLSESEAIEANGTASGPAVSSPEDQTENESPNSQNSVTGDDADENIRTESGFSKRDDDALAEQGNSISNATQLSAQSNSLQKEKKVASLAEKNRSVLPDGEYLIISALNSNRLLDVPGGSRNSGMQIQTYSHNNTKAQKWKISHDADGYVIITNLNSGKVLDVAGGKTTNGTKIQQYQSNNTKSQRFIAVKTSDNKIQLVSALDTAMVVDVSGASTKERAKIQLYRSNNSNAQKFTFKTLHPIVNPGTKTISDGYYTVSSKLGNSLVWDIKSGSTINGGNAQIYQSNGTPAQFFKFTYINGFYRIQAASGKLLDVSGASVMNGANVQQYQSNNTDAQLWRVDKNKDGSYTFTSKVNGLVIDVSGAKAKSGANLQCYSSNNTNAQKFTLNAKTNFINNGTYVVQSGLNTSKVLDVASGSLNNGANVQLYSSNNTQPQKWKIQLVSGQTNVYTLQSVCSGKMLAMDANGNVCVRDKSSDGSQRWKVTISGCRFVFTNVKYSNKSLDVSGARTNNGTNIQGYATNWSRAQGFSVLGTKVLSNGTYFIRSAQNGSQVLDVKSGSSSNGANVQSYGNNNTGAQKWKITQNSDGSYKIVNAKSNKALDVRDGKAIQEANVQQYVCNSSAAQKWYLVDNNDGTFKLSSALNRSMVLTFAGTPSNGVNIYIAKDINAANQKLRFAATSYNPMPAHQQAMLNKAQGYSSRTGCLILVDRAAHKVGVFRGSKGNWTYQHYWGCVTGAQGTPTITGVYSTTGFKRPVLSTDRRARYCTQIRGGYFFHTILASDGELGQSLSHGCIRLSNSNAQWIYNNIAGGTTVVIYN